ncbi:MAG: alpha/beta hydrolase-fold protein [Cytobacillus gottheilii]|uniref:alpha/beta hydrolase n=1 Tax=Cytobacillus gottheilii TaxID=859144 RepID=UPI00083522D5|nr:alpha/beta hydrolase-fold protein [Cytobacillus gottheilii]
MEKYNQTFYSSHLQKTLNYMVLKTKEKIEDAYVLYVQDGRDYWELGGLEKAVQNLVRENPELAQHLVFVLIHPGDSMERWESFSRKGASFQQYLRFMNEEFIPEIERNIDVGKIRKRGLLGDSLAGNISLNIAAEKPEIWTHLLLQSPAVSDEDIGQLEDVNLSGWDVYQSVGIYEDEFVSSISNEKLYILTKNRQLHQTFLSNKAKVNYIETKDEHLWKVWERDLPALLEFWGQVPRPNENMVGLGACPPDPAKEA